MYTFASFILLAAPAAAQNFFSTQNWQGVFAAGSGVLQSLSPISDTSFDFSPSDYFPLRNGVGNYHTGDLTMRWRLQNQTGWEEIDTAAQRTVSPQSTMNQTNSLLHSNFDNVFPAAAKYFHITRDWIQESGDLILQATITNDQAASVEIGAFGFPIEFNSIFTNRTSEETTAKCVLVDPYIGLDAGYAQVTRLTGTGPNMVITPFGNQSRFEAWRFLEEDYGATYYQSQTFEGLYSWQTLSLAYAQNEWNSTVPWNEPTSITLDLGHSVSFAIRFSIAQNVYDIEPAVALTGTPVAIGLPGYILPTDMDGQLFINSTAEVQSLAIEPQGALTLTPSTTVNQDWKAYSVKSSVGSLGRARVTITYVDGKTQTVHYFVTDTSVDSTTKLSDFLFDEQWFTQASDPFHRAPSVISYDHEVGQQILQEERAWIAGISDEGGAGSFEAAAMKTSVHPDAAQVLKLEQMVNTTVWAWLQDTTNNTPDIKYGVKRSLFFYDPQFVPGYQYDPSIDWTTWESWNKNSSYSVWRAYDYVHVSALYWGLYSAERANPGSLTLNNATWYLLQAYHTILETQANDTYGNPVADYADDGLMGETVWLKVLKALHAERLTSEFDSLQAAMEQRQKIWSNETEPFGSEMAWDSTGQEGVYLWSKYFNDTATVTRTLDSIRGYMPTVAHWGWNGNARRYWDFLYAGKLERIERMIHHYGSGLNALPLLNAYQYNPDPSGSAAFHDLRVAYGGTMGPLSNIHADGFGAQAFHSFPDTLAWDAYSGDYGCGYLGHILGARTFLLDHPDFGWIAMGGNVQQNDTVLTIQPRDTVRRSIYVAALGLSVDFDAGQISRFTFDTQTQVLTITLASVDGSMASKATMVFEDTLGTGVILATSGLGQQLDGYAVPIPGNVSFAAGYSAA